MSKKRIQFSDQIRQAVDSSGLSRYRICKEAGIDQATFSRFMSGKVGLSMPTLDALTDVLKLDVIAPQASSPAKRGLKPKGRKP
jgi:transcriptional regulator with XRE-family HTH domain